MWHVGIDLHRATVVVAAVNDVGEAMNPLTIPCSDTVAIFDAVKALGTFRAGLYSAGTLPTVARFDAMPGQAWQTVGRGQNSIAGLVG